MNIVNLVGRLAKDPVARDRSDTRITELILVTENVPSFATGRSRRTPKPATRSRMPNSTRSPSSMAWDSRCASTRPRVSIGAQS